MLQRTVLFCGLTVMTFTAQAAADLDTINQRIASVQQEIAQSAKQKSALQNALMQTETSEHTLNQNIKNIKSQLSAQQQQLQRLQKKKTPLEQQKIQNETLLEKQVHAAYILSRQPELKVLLSEGSVEKTHRVLTYFQYIAKTQLTTIKTLETTLAAYQKNQQIIQEKTMALNTLNAQQLQNQEALKKAQAERQSLIQNIDAQIQTKSARLQLLLDNKTALQKTIESLSKPSHTAPAQTFITHKPFAALQGRLPWPVVGTLIRRFGTPIEDSELKWDGVLIDAPLGRDVHAVADGRVIFAKWMAGYGLLLIISHGNGYMTLYGRNQTLNKQVGDTVKAGDVIATAGKSGGFPESALYFSLRRNTQALNPAQWCR